MNQQWVNSLEKEIAAYMHTLSGSQFMISWIFYVHMYCIWRLNCAYSQELSMFKIYKCLYIYI